MRAVSRLVNVTAAAAAYANARPDDARFVLGLDDLAADELTELAMYTVGCAAARVDDVCTLAGLDPLRLCATEAASVDAPGLRSAWLAVAACIEGDTARAGRIALAALHADPFLVTDLCRVFAHALVLEAAWADEPLTEVVQEHCLAASTIASGMS